jgi:hypothetical protein
MGFFPMGHDTTSSRRMLLFLTIRHHDDDCTVFVHLQNMLAWKKLEESVSLAKLSKPRSERELERLAENLSPPPRNVGPS